MPNGQFIVHGPCSKKISNTLSELTDLRLLEGAELLPVVSLEAVLWLSSLKFFKLRAGLVPSHAVPTLLLHPDRRHFGFADGGVELFDAFGDDFVLLDK